MTAKAVSDRVGIANFMTHFGVFEIREEPAARTRERKRNREKFEETALSLLPKATNGSDQRPNYLPRTPAENMSQPMPPQPPLEPQVGRAVTPNDVEVQNELSSLFFGPT
jgi:hypothetical protein